MDDFNRFHHLLTIAADPPGPPVLPPDLIPRARRRQRQHRELAGVAAVVAALLLASPLAVVHRDSSRPVGQPASVPAVLHAAAPAFPIHGNPLPFRQRLCRPGDVRGNAETTASAYGLLGVIWLHGRQCSLLVDTRSMVLLDAAGHPLGVPLRSEPNLNPGENPHFDRIQAAGDVVVGFAWRGPWCGRPAAGLRMVVVQPREILVIPLSGPSPKCAGTASSGYLVPGLVGSPGRAAQGRLLGAPDDAVQTAPPAWRALRARLELPGTIRPAAGFSYRVVLQNVGPVPVTLDPCPDFQTKVEGMTAAPGILPGYLITGGPAGSLPCGEVLSAGERLLLPLRFDGTGNGLFVPGVVRVEWAMAGVPTASGTVRVR